jgi:hypothetical protein
MSAENGERIPGWVILLAYLVVSTSFQPLSAQLGGGAAEQLACLIATVLVWLLALIALPVSLAAVGRSRTALRAWPLLGVAPGLFGYLIYRSGDSSMLHWINLAGVVPALLLGLLVIGWIGRKKRNRSRP